ncbi:MAG: methyltransferase domain-containing protein [Bacteroidota bacterium]
MANSKEYLLGTNNDELERLRFQHGVWRSVTDGFLDRLRVAKGWNCLDVGAGPGFVTMDLRERIGESGVVTALEPSELYVRFLQNEIEKKGWKNVRSLQGTAASAELPAETYDLIFVRWVINFLDDREAFLTKLFSSLKQGGIIAIQDYWYEGLSLYPKGSPFERMADIIRGYYRAGGGDPYATGTVPSLFTRHGISLVEFSPHQIAGGPDTPIFEWVHRFLMLHLPLMVEKGVITQEECDIQTSNWLSYRGNPESIYFSPLVVDIAGRR